MKDDSKIVAEKNKEIVEEAYAEAAKGNWDGFFANFHPDCLTIVANSLPHGGTYRGPKGARFAVNAGIGLWQEHHFEIEELTATENRVYVYLYIMAKGKATGETFSMPMTEVWRLRDGKVMELRAFYFDADRARRVYNG